MKLQIDAIARTIISAIDRIVLRKSANAEDHKIASDIEILMADMLNHSSSNI